MNETAVNDNFDGLLIDGEPPRLGQSGTPVQPAEQAPELSSFDSGPVLSTPDEAEAEFVAPSVGQPIVADSPTLPTLPMPTLPSVVAAAAPVTVAYVEETAHVAAAAPAEPRHPMAHLMPDRLQPNEASQRAAERRAAQKAKARRNKIITIAVIVAIGAAAGPPVAKWTMKAINESGGTTSDEPAATTIAPTTSVAPAASAAPTTVVAPTTIVAPVASAPATTPATASAASVTPSTAPGVLGAIDAAQDVVDATNQNATATP